ncbi:hypothetical protein I4U23_008960 [Adineta vaga]|nr:hypothetical protein I4U23_008960 [Adineta vaga]
MSESEADLDTDQYDDDDGDFVDDIRNEMYNDGDDYCDFGDTGRFTSLYQLILGKTASDLVNVDEVEIPTGYIVHLAINSQNDYSANVTSSELLVNDSLQMYLSAPPLIRKAPRSDIYCLSLDPMVDENGLKPLSTAELYIGNLPGNTRWFELKNWFQQFGFGVSHVSIKRNKIGATYAFVRFDSIATAVDVYHANSRKRIDFTFKYNALNIDRPKKQTQQTNAPSSPSDTNNFESNDITFPITDIHYGTLITGAAMRYIHRGNSIISNSDDYGIVAHRLMNYDYETNFRFVINVDKKKLSIVARYMSFPTEYFDSINELKFEWNFQDLKSTKISPVLINRDHVYLLMELKRPPIIVETQNTDSMGYGGSSDETRQPGTGLIGHANAWLFRLNSRNWYADYRKLFKILHDYNLTPRHFTENDIGYLIGSLEAARTKLDSIELISNDDWIKANRDKVDDFLQRRWALYPFETKFEIMKLISKHIITVYDLIVDEQAENVLKLCTINTLIALTDKIVEFAPRWFSKTCDYNEQEDWDNENEQIQSDLKENRPTIAREDIPSTTDNLPHESQKSLFTSSKVSIGTFSRLLMYALEQLLEKYELYRIPMTGIFVTKVELRTANMNPSFIRPYREEKCPVTRQFEKYQDRFLRVTFRDEDYRVLHNYNDSMSTIYERIKKILIQGINICDRHYEFLAFSSSQLREHSCWMFASIKNDVTVDTIHNWMGNFQNVRPVAKLAARLGQLFSTSIKGIKLEKHQFTQLRDFEICQEINGRFHCPIFTDGIGIISPKFAEKLAEEMKLSNKSFCPSAFQIRCGGYKGMVCVDTRNHCVDPNISVYFRPSMKKFETENFSIDVVRTSLTPSIAYLNRQIILLLASLGIPKSKFISLQNQMLEQMKALTGNAKDACKAIKDLNEFGGNGYHAFLIDYLNRLGERKDPFVQQLLLAFKTFLVKELRTKAKIRVPNSWCLLGVIDETETLNYGEVFIQIDNSHQKSDNPIKEIFTGDVVVTRNPCFHPGDIRKLKAVDVPALRCLKNVIVFPMDGLRPHPMEMSGGDLDGDTFWISRHPDLIFEQNEDPFDYQEQDDEADAEIEDTRSQPKISYTIKDVCNFFGEYIAADNLGMIANSHLVFADQSEAGAKDEKCLKLARMHSVAVDFAKKGVSAPRLTKELRPQEYPHYMEKKDKKSYPSKTILGVLYDEIQHYKIDLCIDKDEEIQTALSFPYDFFIINGDGTDVYRKEAHILKNSYDRELRRLMKQYGIEYEVEIVSGYILKFTSKQYAKETKLFDLKNEITHAYRILQNK